MQIDPKRLADVSEKLEAARVAFFEYWLAMNVSVRAQGIENGQVSLGHILTREEQAAVLAQCLQQVQSAGTMQQAAERTRRLRTSFGHPTETDAAAPVGKRLIVLP
jgi:molybdenum cofactor biosynthesis enzyme